MAIFDHATQKSLSQLLGFMNLYQHVKNHFIHLFVFKIQSICPVSRLATTIFNQATQKFWSAFNF